jgi:hypothetical protein
MAKLLFLNGDCAGRVCELGDGQYAVGRGELNQVILEDPTVSRNHCVLLIYGPEVLVRDLSSLNGTLVHSHVLRGCQRQVLSGQIIQFGLTTARLELEPPRPSKGSTTALFEYRDYVRSSGLRAGGVPLAKSFQQLAGQPSGRVAVRTTLMEPPPVTSNAGTTHFIRRGTPFKRPGWRVAWWVWVVAVLVVWGMATLILLR